MNRRDYHAAKFGSWERSPALDAQLTEAERAESIRFTFEKMGRTPNTLDAHRLIRLTDLVYSADDAGIGKGSDGAGSTGRPRGRRR
jgi:predicted DsbA family dithiol-disulfide isomerase